MIEELKKHRVRQNREKLLLGEAYRDHGLVFCLQDGGPIDPRNFTRHYESLIKRAGLPHTRFHDLRHTHTSHLLQMGVQVNVVQERLGHAKVRMTLETYAHVLPGQQEEAAAKINTLLQIKEIPSIKEGI